MEGSASNKNLNLLLKGEQMAVAAYEQHIRAADNGTIKTRLREIQLNHKEHVRKLADRISSMGGRPDYGTGVAGAVSGVLQTLNAGAGGDPVEILKKAYDGEDRGIETAEKVFGSGLDAESKKLVDNILTDDHIHLETMLSLMEEYGYER